jgi:sugar lactone lactonase YvrE
LFSRQSYLLAFRCVLFLAVSLAIWERRVWAAQATRQRALLHDAQVRRLRWWPGEPIIDPPRTKSGKGRLGLATLACVGLAFAISTPASAWDRGTVENFFLPSGSPMVEGLTVGPDGLVYAATFNPTGSPPSQLFTFNPDGTLKKQVSIKGSSQAMLGLEVIPGTTNALLVLDFGAGQVLAVDPTKNGNNASVCITLPPGNQAPVSGLNGITFDQAGNVYFSDSFQGIIWRFSPKESGSMCGQASPWVTDATLLPNNGKPPEGVPPFGANGVEFNKAGDAMFVCNTAMDWIVKIPVMGGTPGTPVVFTNSLNGCDGLRLDSNDNIWVAANQADEIVVVDHTGKAIAKLGDFNGVQNGETQGLLFPASPAFSPDGTTLYVTNLELDLRTIGITQSVDSQWAAQVTRHSIAKLSTFIPPPGP